MENGQKEHWKGFRLGWSGGGSGGGSSAGAEGVFADETMVEDGLVGGFVVEGVTWIGFTGLELTLLVF